MSNSPLVDFTQISPNKTSPRNHKIDTISIHCVVGQVTVERLGQIFAPEKKRASSNYGIGYDGKIGMYVEEKDRSWCTSSEDNDNRAITIEVASDAKHPYAITDAAYKSLIKLLADICKRNGIKELKWRGDKKLIGQVDKQNMTVHRWFAAKACPGKYLYDRHGQIAFEVNALLGTATTEPKAETAKPKVDAALKKDTKLAGSYKTTYKTGLNLRTGARANKKKLAVLPYGTIVRNYGYYNVATNGVKWLYVKTPDGTVGYCSSTYLKKC